MKWMTWILGGLVLVPQLASAFCGFYVAKADTKLFNKASKVAIVRDGNRTVLTMANDFKGDPKEFAMVIPVPTFLEKDQIHVGNIADIDHLDAYSSPRLVEYFDDDPCALKYEIDISSLSAVPQATAEIEEEDLGVTIEASYTVGEYDILILSAKESDGLETWLTQNEYKIPEGASKVLESYIKQGMRFFVAKVNLKEQVKSGAEYLRPLQIAYESPKFTLPIRLGTINADGPQELFAFILTKKGRVETTNYKTVKLPSNMEVPLFVKDDFSDFYIDMFDHQVQQHKQKAVFMEYAWDMAWCDPCAADPLSKKELASLGVWWLPEGKGQAQNVFLTRLHVRYTAETFPEDLVFQQTSDRSNWQGRYILQHPFKGKIDCKEGKNYIKELPKRMKKRAENLAELTGWKMEDITKRMDIPEPSEADEKWYKKLWKKS